MAIPIKCLVSHRPPPQKVGSVGRIKKKNQKKFQSNTIPLNWKLFLFSLKFPKIWVGYIFFKVYFEKKWVGRAMGNETIYWDGLWSEHANIWCHA